MILSERRAWLNNMNIASSPQLLAEWSALVAELDRVHRESLGVDERGYERNPSKSTPRIRRSQSFLGIGARLYGERTGETRRGSSRPRSKSILGTIGGLLKSQRRDRPQESLFTNSEEIHEAMSPKPWGQLAPADVIVRRPRGFSLRRAHSQEPDSRTSTRTPTDRPDAAFALKAPPQRLRVKQERLRLALAIHKEKTRRRKASVSVATPGNCDVGNSCDTMRDVARAVAQARVQALVEVNNVPVAAANTPSAPKVWSAARDGVTAGPAAGRLLVELVRYREQARDPRLEAAAAVAPLVGWV